MILKIADDHSPTERNQLLPKPVDTLIKLEKAY